MVVLKGKAAKIGMQYGKLITDSRFQKIPGIRYRHCFCSSGEEYSKKC